MSSVKPPTTFLFDLDGTLTKQEMLPAIAAALSIEEEIAELTQKTIAGAVPYHESLQHRVRLLSQAPNQLIQEVIRSVPLHEELYAFIREFRDYCYIVTANLDVWVKDYLNDLGLLSYTSIASVRGSHVLSLDVILDKRQIAINYPNCIAVGDGHNDTGMLEEAAVGIACGLVHEPAPSLFDVASHVVYQESTLCRLLRQL